MRLWYGTGYARIDKQEVVEVPGNGGGGTRFYEDPQLIVVLVDLSAVRNLRDEFREASLCSLSTRNTRTESANTTEECIIRQQS